MWDICHQFSTYDTPYADYEGDVLTGWIDPDKVSVRTTDPDGVYLGRESLATLRADVDELERRMPEVVERLRDMMP